ncbi:diacylglycerol kinase family protein [Streptomyces sp. NBC_00513]|uniref:diacylglycerol kinase family protein n=1 Tax=unclassified Streptomyces TaxID=2593676 RepID=UPI00225C33F4|nr:diacylglycerol kinase family protein [Streptomyces sp. NBC_00424]MCX5071591.1 diacylglycerol kinase family protein [Streptomyces sp. NBC_00424]WUD45015.1 diacylglycerol kinase family protein [Streptomyces sp. NBC_00513]
MRNERGDAARRGGILLLLPVQVALMTGLGLLITVPLAGRWPLSAEDGVNRAFAAHRGEGATELSEWLSLLASTRSVIGLSLLCVAALLLLPRVAWRREAAFLALSVAAQSAVFLLVTLVVERSRPDVPHLDPAPPTSSFPSGHVGAATALFGALATIAATRLHGVRRVLAVGALALIPVAVALSRLYRGMHHPSDVLGGLLNGACTLFVVGYALLLPARSRRDHASRSGTTRDAALPATRTPADADADTNAGDDPEGLRAGRVVVVRHPHSCDDELAERVRSVLSHRGHPDQVWTETSADDPSGGLAARIGDTGTTLVVACGGDGTVRACAEVLAGTDIALAVVPCGTGNLLARNLRLPADPATALDAALSGRTTRIDMGRLSGDRLEPARFTVMAGAGLDAAMVRDASDRLKERVGWAAYVVSAFGHLRDPRMRLSIRLDDGAELERRARMVVIGNVGTLQGGLPLLPDARPDSGRLDMVLLDPRGAAGWLVAAGHVMSRALPGRASSATRTPAGAVAGGALEYFNAARIDIRFSRPQPRELDGDAVASGARLTAEVEPGALRLCLPTPRPRVASVSVAEGGAVTTAG